MAVIYLLDDWYLAITFLLTLAWQLAGFAIAYGFQIDTITDFWSAVNFFALAIMTLNWGNQYYGRNIAASVLAMLWAVRLGGWQLFRVSKMGGDSRFDEMRSQPLKFAGFWSFQTLWVWTVSLPFVILNSPAASVPSSGGIFVKFGTGKDIAGLVLFSLGLLIEATADLQKYLFKQDKSVPEGAITDGGLWRWSRRPNYFGEIVAWWGMYLLCISPALERDSNTGALISQGGRNALLASVFSPLLTMTLLLFLSGLPLSEKPSQQKYFLMSHGPGDEGGKELQPFPPTQKETDPWARMRAFRERTSMLIPLPNALYRPLPRWFKTVFLFDLPIYRFDEARDGTKAIHEAEQKQNQREEEA